MLIKFVNTSFLILYCSLIFWLSSQSSLPSPVLFSHQDKIIHMGAYFIMAILAWRFFNNHIKHTATLLIISLSYCSLFGISDEWHQSYVPGREADIFDWFADTIGASIALCCIYYWNLKRHQKHK